MRLLGLSFDVLVKGTGLAHSVLREKMAMVP